MSADLPIPELPLPLKPERIPAWGWLDVTGYAFIYFLTSIIAISLGAVAVHYLPYFAHTPMKELSHEALFLVPVQIACSVLAFLIWRMVVTVKAQKDFWDAVQWRMPEVVGKTGYVALGVVLAFVISLAEQFLPMPETLPIEKMYRTPTDAWLMLMFGVLVAPIIEEIYFRGLLFPVAERSFGVRFAVIFTSLGFAAIHASQLAQSFVPLMLIFVVGYVLTTVRARSGSLAASWLVHAAYNGTLFSFMLFATDGFQHLEKMK